MVTQYAERQDTVFRALADPTRRNILSLLRTGEQPVNAIARGFPVSRPAISKHLRLLLDAELVYERRDGRNRLYQLNAKPLKSVDDWLEEYRTLWQGKLKNLKHYLESPKKEEAKHGPHDR
ncbi:MAG: metalloregulator ArsR/SmtB family transcription factor [Bryobacteraceae bacterium]